MRSKRQRERERRGEGEREIFTPYDAPHMQFKKKIPWQEDRQGVGDLLWKDASVANSRMPIRLLGHNQSRTGFSLFLSPSPPSLYSWSIEVGKNSSSYFMNNTGIRFLCCDFFSPPPCPVIQVQHGKHPLQHQHHQQQCRWALIWTHKWKRGK